MKIMILGVLGLLSYEDIRRKTVPIWQLVVLGVLCVAYTIHNNILCNETSYNCIWYSNTLLPGISLNNLCGILFGSVVLIICTLTGCIGLGDSIVYLLLGIGFGGVSMINIFILSLLFMGVGAVIMLIFKRIHIKSEIPLMPYILLAAIKVIV